MAVTVLEITNLGSAHRKSFILEHTESLLGIRDKIERALAKAYDMIEALSEELRLELFGRQYRMGWETWGDELGIKIPSLAG